MLDFFAVGDLSPWPDDLPADRTHLGSLDEHEFDQCRTVLSRRPVDRETRPDYHEDWLLEAEDLPAIIEDLAAFERETTATDHTATRKLAGFLAASGDRRVLAVCD